MYFVLWTSKIISLIDFLLALIIELIVINISNNTANNIPINIFVIDIVDVCFDNSIPFDEINKTDTLLLIKYANNVPINPPTRPYMAFSKIRMVFILPLVAPILLNVPITGILSETIILFNPFISLQKE